MVSPESTAPDLGGVDPDVADKISGYYEESAETEIWPENQEAFHLFDRCQTQWRVGMSGPTGLDYTGVEVVVRAMRIEDTLDALDRLQVMEHEALKVFSEQRNH